MDMGRIPQKPAGRLAAFQRARDLGATQPSLLVWIARAAIDAGNLEQAKQAGQELLALVDAARAQHGDRLDWPEQGRDLWARANAVVHEPSAARALITARGEHANQKHWGHSVLGVVAARYGNIEAAIWHLAESASVVGEPRLSSYGPSFRLARELVTHGQWAVVSAYLHGCRAFWDREEIDGWLAELAERRIPEFLDQ